MQKGFKVESALVLLKVKYVGQIHRVYDTYTLKISSKLRKPLKIPRIFHELGFFFFVWFFFFCSGG